ncbi:hypothetical protein Godav_004056 [Gossypium davidsonii]|uniref:Uncharacterized protein n=2 Tax=Gossypium TaxID=3633 RepID=A0A7J8SLG5_GOSDV|nr:hypothetical protein [Gossypium davidsonii]MBA0661988.1 hypothetical protein [Gossypium klotzschianum]
MKIVSTFALALNQPLPVTTGFSSCLRHRLLKS